MSDIYFFTDVDLLNVQTAEQAFGPVSGCEETQYRVTSMHTAKDEPNAYSVCDGVIFAQYADENHINILIRPQQLGSYFAKHVRYYIYKGINKSSLIQHLSDKKIDIIQQKDFSDRPTLLDIIKNALKDNPDIQPKAYTKQGFVSANVLGLGECDEFLNNKPIDYIFQMNLLEPFIHVPAGTILGSFDKDSFGFEVVTNDVHNGVSIGSLKSFPEIITCEGTGTNAKEKFLLATRRERILNYIDPCCFFASFYEVKDKWANYNTSKKTNLRLGNGSFVTNSYLYENILSKFLNKNIIYLDIRNQVDNSLNYLHNYSDSTSEYATIRIGYDGGEKTELLYKDNYGWPLLRIPTSQFTRVHQQKPSSITVQLPIGDNQRPKIYTEQGCFYKDFPHSEKVLRDLYRDVDYPTYTIVFALGVPKHNPTTTLPCHIKLRYFRGIQEDYNVNLNDEHFLDNLFSVNKLMSMEGDSPRLPFRSMDGSQWFSEVEDVFLDKASGYGKDVTLKSGVIQEENTITFYALKDTKLLQGNGQQQSNLQNVPYLQNSEMSKLVISGNHPLVKTNVLPDSMFSEEVENLLNDDGRDIVLLQIAKYEWQIIRDAVLQQLDERFDAHISLRHKGTNNNIAQYEIVVRGFVEGDTDFEKETISTGIYIFKQTDDNGKRLFYTEGISSLFQNDDVIERNKRNFQGSFITREAQLNVRSSCSVATDDNKIVQLVGEVKLNILGKHEDDNKNVWYYVERTDKKAFEENHINGVYKYRGWIRPNLTEDDKFDRVFYPVASMSQFLLDLHNVNQQLDCMQKEEDLPIDTLAQRITRLRQMTHVKNIVGEMFNVVINSNSDNPKPKYLNNIEYEKGYIKEYDNYLIDTKIQIFKDYMGVKITDNIIIDLHHLFVGLDVLNHKGVDNGYIIYVLSVLFLGYDGVNQSDIPKTFGDNVAFATWAGDLGSVAVEYLLHIDKDAEKYIKEVSMKNARNEDQDKEIFNHYYYTRASNIDLISDIVVHKIHERILGNKNSTIESIVYNAFLEIRNNGLKSFYESFFKYEGIDMTKTITYISQPETYWKIREAINLFSRWWKLSQLLQYIPIESIKNENEKVTKKFINEFLNCMLKEISSR